MRAAWRARARTCAFAAAGVAGGTALASRHSQRRHRPRRAWPWSDACKHGRTPAATAARKRGTSRAGRQSAMPFFHTSESRVSEPCAGWRARRGSRRGRAPAAPRAGRASARAVARAALHAHCWRDPSPRGARAHLPARVGVEPSLRRVRHGGRAAQRQQQCGAPRPPPPPPIPTRTRASARSAVFEFRHRCVSTSELRAHFDSPLLRRVGDRTLIVNPNNKTLTRLHVRVSLQSVTLQ